jgi:beta-RFAP synthase
MPATVEVITPSRLHFGMFSFGREGVRQFGGVGLMLEHPGIHLRISPAERFEATGSLHERVPPVASRWRRHERFEELPACRVAVVSAPPEHTGLGTGTQLELAVVAGLNAFQGHPPLSALELATISGRGARSAIGTYGFLLGGLLVESGKLPDEILSPLEQRLELPEAWRIVLITLPRERGLAGDAEQLAFAELPPVPPETTERLRAQATGELLPAAAAGDFARFSESLYRFGHLAGTCFAKSQGGPFASAEVAQLVSRLREAGIAGVGQSSWGPTVFAVVDSDDAATQLSQTLEDGIAPQATWQITRPARHGAQIVCHKT